MSKVEQFRIPFTVKEMEIMLMYIDQDSINQTDPTWKELYKKLKVQHFKCSEGLKKADYVNINKPKKNSNPNAVDLGLEDYDWEGETARIAALMPNQDRRKEQIETEYVRRDTDSEAADAALFLSDIQSDIDKY